MVNEMGKWAFVGAAIGILVFAILFGYIFFNKPVYTEEEKQLINEGITVNCTACLVRENTTCDASNIIDSQWGAICDSKYVRNCTQACRFLK